MIDFRAWPRRFLPRLPFSAARFPRAAGLPPVRAWAAWLSAILLGMLPSACVQRETAVQRGNREQVLHRSLGYDVTDLDPHVVTGIAEGEVLRALFEGLVNQDPVDLHPIPGVAERWEVSPDGLVYTFHLRADARWSNGTPVTAQDFVASFRRVLTPELAADYAHMLYVLQGAEAYHKGTNRDFSLVGVSATSPRVLRLQLEHPAPYFLALLVNPVWRPVPLATIEQHGRWDQRGNPWTRPERMVSNGPFVLKKWTPNQVIIVEKSPTYWDAARVRLNGVHFYPIDSRDAEERAFRAGQLHLTDAVPFAKIAAYKRDAPHLLRVDPYLGTEFLRLNTRRAPFNDARIRRAFSLAIDRETLVKALGGEVKPAQAFTPPGTAGYTSVAQIRGDAAAARQLLKDAGYEGGRGLPVIEFLYPNSENVRVMAEALQEMWRRNLGVEVRLLNQELKVTFAARRTGDYQLMRSNWIGDYLDAGTFLEIFRGDSGNNHTGWAEPAYDAILFAAARTADPAARIELLQKAEAMLLEAAPIIPVYHYMHVFLKQPSVRGWHPTLLDHHPYQHVWLEP